MNFKQTAIKAAKAAGKIQLKYYRKNIAKRYKDKDSVVTKADIECSKKIKSIILTNFPDHGYLDEELGSINKRSHYRWIIDPLDGTHNFVMDNPIFGVSIALVHKNEVILGVIYLPVFKKLCYAEKGKGAFCNGKKMHVNKINNLKKCLFIFDAKLRTKTNKKIKILKTLAPLTWRIRIYGTAIYHILLVAEGKAGFDIDFNSKPWDHAAALLMVEEAGGKVTGVNGEKWNHYIKDYLASNGKVHKKVLDIINR